MVIVIDIDGVICTNTDGDYERATPFQEQIARVNGIADQGHTVILWTARGTTTGREWRQLTTDQLREWGVRYSELRFGKPYYDRLVDDKACSSLTDLTL